MNSRRNEMAHPRHARLRGVMLFEMLIVVALLGVILLLASRVFITSFALVKQANTAERAVSQWRSATDQLRQDVWNADTIELIDKTTVRISCADGPTVQWRRETETITQTLVKQVLHRRVTDQGRTESSRRWTDHGWDGAFEVHGPVLVVNIPRNQHLPETQLHLVSQLALISPPDSPPDSFRETAP